MRALFYDTETTGLPLFNEPSEDPRQPHIVQLGDRMKAAGFNKFKSANLREAYKLVGAHSAMADAQACQYVYFAIKSGVRAVPAAAAGVHA